MPHYHMQFTYYKCSVTKRHTERKAHTAHTALLVDVNGR